MSSRIDSSVSHNGPTRFATEDLTVGDVTIPVGDTVVMAVPVANRNEQRWPEHGVPGPSRPAGQGPGRTRRRALMVVPRRRRTRARRVLVFW